MKRYFVLLPLVILLLLFAGYSPSAAQAIDTTEWVDIGGLKIPSTWSSSPSDSGGPPDDLDITGEGVGGSIRMFYGYGFAGSLEMLIADSISSQAFVFDDKQSGYMLEFPDRIIWVRESYASVLLFHRADSSIFIDNKDLILSIARTLTDEDEPDDAKEYYAYALHAVMRAKGEAGVKNVVLHDIDGCGSVEMIILDEGIPESDDFWGTTAKGFRILIYDAKYQDRDHGRMHFSSDEITYATYKVYITKKNDLVVYDSFEGETYQVLRYSGGTLSEAAVLVDASYAGETFYSVNGVECGEAQFLEKLNEYGIADADNISLMIGKGHMGWEAPFEKDIPEKSSDAERILF